MGELMADHSVAEIVERVTRDEGRPVYLISMWKVNSHVAGFKVFECLEYEPGGAVVLNDRDTGGKPADSREEAQWVLEGHLKWDGCINFRTEENGCAAHLCGLSYWRRFAAMFEEVYKLAAELMPEHRDSILED